MSRDSDLWFFSFLRSESSASFFEAPQVFLGVAILVHFFSEVFLHRFEDFSFRLFTFAVFYTRPLSFAVSPWPISHEPQLQSGSGRLLRCDASVPRSLSFFLRKLSVSPSVLVVRRRSSFAPKLTAFSVALCKNARHSTSRGLTGLHLRVLIGLPNRRVVVAAARLWTLIPLDSPSTPRAKRL
jgi:hypothetical protein